MKTHSKYQLTDVALLYIGRVLSIALLFSMSPDMVSAQIFSNEISTPSVRSSHYSYNKEQDFYSLDKKQFTKNDGAVEFNVFEGDENKSVKILNPLTIDGTTVILSNTGDFHFEEEIVVKNGGKLLINTTGMVYFGNNSEGTPKIIRALDNSIVQILRVEDLSPVKPEKVNNGYVEGYEVLKPNTFPNPFDRYTNVNLYRSVEGPCSISVYEISGQRAKIIYEGNLKQGMHQFSWDGTNSSGQEVPAGVYIIRIASGDTDQSIRCVKN